MADTIVVSCAGCGSSFSKPRLHSNSIRFCSESCRLWSRVDSSAGPDACWPWLGSKDQSGYGMFMARGRSHRAHRLAYEDKVGPIPDGLLACHRCDNPCCCNPAHIFLGTAGDNNRDRARKGRTNYAAAIEVMRRNKIGKRPPESTLEAARRANTGKKRPPEVIAKMAAAHLGKKRSEETKAKLREAWVRRKQAGRM